MSAYIVNKEHIVYLVTAATSDRLTRGGGRTFRWYHNDERHELNAGDDVAGAELGNLLWRENVASVSARYPNESSATLPGPIGGEFVIQPFHFQGSFSVHIDPVQVLKACDCFEYQSCEHEGWKTSEAKAVIDALRRVAWHNVPGYEEAVWGAPEKPAAPQISLYSCVRKVRR